MRARRLASVAGVLAALVAATPAAAQNLIVNGDAEQGAAGTDTAFNASPAGWEQSVFTPTQIAYGALDFPSTEESERIGGGNAFFAGGPNAQPAPVNPHLQQTIDVTGLSGTMTLEGDLGGYDIQPDETYVYVEFLVAGSDVPVRPDGLSIGPVTPEMRENATRLEHLSSSDSIPADAHTAIVHVVFYRPTDSGYVDGYADNLELTGGTPPVETPTPTPSPTATSAPEPTAAPGPTPVAASNPQPSFDTTVAGPRINFDGSASTNVSSYVWDIGGQKVDCGNQPQLTVTATQTPPGAQAILEATSPSGTTATASQSVPRLPGRSTRGLTTGFGSSFFCDGLPLDPNDFTEHGGPPAGCNYQIHVGLVSAKGCLRKLSTRAEIKSELLDALRGAYAEDPELRDYVRAAAPMLPDATVPDGNLDLTARELDTVFDLGEFYASSRPVRVNGLDFYPRDGTEIIIASALDLVVAEKAVVKLHEAVIREGAVILDVREARGEVPVGRIGLKGDMPDVGGFPLRSAAQVRFTRRGAKRVSVMDVHLDASGRGLTLEDGSPPVLDVELTADNEHGLVEEPQRLTLDRVRFGEWPIRDVEVVFTPNVAAGRRQDVSEDDVWNFAGDLLLSGLEEFGLRFTPPPASNGIVFADGRFQSAGATLDLGEPPKLPPIPVAPAVFLDQIGARFAIEPTSLFGGSARFKAVGFLELQGRFLAAFPSARAPYRLTEDDIPGLPPDVLDEDFTDPVFGLSGTMALVNLPVIDRIDLVDAHFVYGYPGKVAFGARLREQNFLEIIKVSAAVQGRINFATGRFQFDGGGHACLFSSDGVCGGAIFVLSSQGMGGCVTVGVGGEEINVGGGVQWNGPEVYFWPLDGCKWTRFTEDNVSRRQAGPYVVQAKAGASEAIELRGAGPVRVTGPDGETLESPSGSDARFSRRIRILHSVEHDLTVIGLQDPLAGAYRIEPLSGTLGTVSRAADPPDAKVNARMSGRGTRRTLRYDIARRDGQTVTFMDGGRILGTATGGRGTLRFDALPGAHTITAQFALDGQTVPTENPIVARYRGPAATRLARPTGLRVRRGTARWRGRGNRFAVVVRERGGRALRTVTRRHRLRLRADRTLAGTVSVRALDAVGRAGPAARAKYRATKRARTRLRPYSSLN